MALSVLLLALSFASATDSVSTSIDSAKTEPAATSALPAAPIGAVSDSSSPVPVVEPGPAVVVPSPATVPVVEPGPVGPVGPVQIPAASTFGPVGPVSSSSRVIAGPTVMVGIDTLGSGTSRRSTAAAVGLSLVLPGWGHRYLGYTSRATPYFASELVGWVALFGSWMTGKAALSNAAEIANRDAGAMLGSNPNEDLLSAIRSYRSRRQVGGRHDSYNETMVLSGKSPEFQFADDDAHNWDWGTRENPDNDRHIRSFENQLRLWRGSRVASYSTIGALAVVRVVAAMDVLRLTRSAASRAGISLDTRPLPGGMDATLAVNF